MGAIGIILKWILSHKAVALCLALLLIAIILLGITRVALSTKIAQVKLQEAKIERQKGEILELQAIQKEQEAGIAALKLYADQIAKRKKEAEIVTVYMSDTTPQMQEILNHEILRQRNHCLFGYFVNRVLPDGCLKTGESTVPQPTPGTK